MKLLSTSLLSLIASTFFFMSNASPVSSPSPSIVERDLASKKRLFPNGLGGPLLQNYNSKVKPAQGTIKWLPKGYGPQICKDRAQEMSGGKQRCPLSNLKAFEVKYSDCPKAWTFCRCNDAAMSAEQIKDNFGRIPPKMRSWVKHIVAFQPGKTCGGAGSNGDVISFFGACDTTTFIHETSHSLDQGFSGTTTWTSAVESDTCIPDAYAGTNYVEDFAQVCVVLMSQKNAGSTGGFNTACMKHQLDAVWKKYGSSMSNANWGTCNMAVRNRGDSPIVKW